MKQTQKDWAVHQLETNGRVSRNDALNNHITRLGAVAHELKEEGYDLYGVWVRTEFGKDYVYMKRNKTFVSLEEANNFIVSLREVQDGRDS